MEIKIVLNGVEQTVTKSQLFDFAANGTIYPDTNISIDGQLIPAVRIKGIVFGKSTNYQVPVPPPLPDSVQNNYSVQNDFPFSFDNIPNNNPFSDFSQQIPQQEYTGNTMPIQSYPQYSPYSSRRSTNGNGKAITSFVCGICSLMFCGGLLILPILGLIFGVLGLNSKKQGLAIAGIVLSCFSIFLSIISVALLLPAVQAAREASF